MVPNKESSTRFNQPWINNAVKRLSRRKQRCYNRARNTGVIGMRVSPGIVFPAHISLGMRVSPHIYH